MQQVQRNDALHRREERSLGELFAELASETGTLVRHEVQLAKTEMSAKAMDVGKDVGVIAAGGAVAYAGLLAVVAGVVLGLGYLIPLWLSSILVGLAIAAGGYVLIQKGLAALKTVDPAPRQTIETLKEDAQWAKQQIP